MERNTPNLGEFLKDFFENLSPKTLKRIVNETNSREAMRAILHLEDVKLAVLILTKKELDSDLLDETAIIYKDWEVLRLVAQNKNTLGEVLDYLSYNEDYSVRYEVSKNPNAFEETLERLSKDGDDQIRDKAKESLENRRK